MCRGHLDARYYPLWKVWVEFEIAVDIEHRQLADQALTINASVGAQMSKKGYEHFESYVKRLRDGG